ncbi:DNA mismatch repair endonuclease MutL [Rhizosphaericola mali]|uniref:DNA mismatch repair protein MutL n=1 Tax=Rhizosphaericola mali TaxID=2545455 RepID=A0A5P2G0I0_9BACT|nr:DNA mismatch repair endonuclease MutL [Rhizosphaericola mali]QES87320.1 DNA mismatch repair endonuclease MutL [Rhizosphaericola mali]
MDIIQLLPDNIANQIAAGEVIQRPASAVKELLENAVDAGATEIKLIVQDAGKALIQVVDNGKGMSFTDARLCFERHATSKIKQIEDLFNIKTMGFRGEALASVAAVAQVELKSRRKEDELGTYLEVENSEVKLHEPCAAPLGTSISMKNLFFNIPARRNFLKSNAAEMRHIVDEFIHVAMAFPALSFSLTSNGQEMFHLDSGSLKQRVVQILGNNLNSKLVNVSDHTDYLNIEGFVGKPEIARKTRGDQYFFVNNRFIKSPYLNHAVTNAFDQLLPKESFPLYVLFIELDPSEVDINVHPTKQEIKFEDEKIIYAFVQAAIKHALAQFSVAPTLDFTLNADIQNLNALTQPFSEDKQSDAQSSNLFKTFTQKNQAHFIDSSKEKKELQDWQNFFEPSVRKEENSFPEFPKDWSAAPDILTPSAVPVEHLFSEEKSEKIIPENAQYLQLHKTYILVSSDQGLCIVHQQIAHERILYEKYSQMSHEKHAAIQQLLFPSELELAPADAFLLEDLSTELKKIGYLIEKSSTNKFTILGVPVDVTDGNEMHIIELLLEQFKHFSSDIKFSKREKIVRCLARQQAIKSGKVLSQEEMQNLVEQLFSCKIFSISPTGDIPTYVLFKEDYIDRLFGMK